MEKKSCCIGKGGQSLFEVVFALGIVGVMLTGLVSLTTTSVRNATFSSNSAQATKYVQEALEWIRNERDIGWTRFTCSASGTGRTWCLRDTSWSISGSCGGSDYISGTNLKREADIVLTDSGVGTEDVINVSVSVFWTDSQGAHETKSITQFTKWREPNAETGDAAFCAAEFP